MTSEDPLVAVLSEFARTRLTDLPIQIALEHLVQGCVDVLPIDAASVSLVSATTAPGLVAGSDGSATRYERLQAALGDGPSTAVEQTTGPIAVPNLADDHRFPLFAERALGEGVAAVFTFPLRHCTRTMGALTLYRRTTGDLDAGDVATAQMLAEVATSYLLDAQARHDRANLIAAISHELQTPATSIVGFAEMLLDGEAGTLSSDQEDYLEKIIHSTNRLTVLIKDLLAMSSQEYARARHDQEPTDLRTVVAAAKATFQPIIASRDLDVTFDSPADPVMVLGNAAELESLVSNLLSNALKYTKDGGWVRCTLRNQDHHVALEVADNGLGIPPDEQSQLFTPFFRSSTAQDSKIQGTGLGLSVVDTVAKSHRGSIAVDSTHHGGSTFTVTLPSLGPAPNRPG